MKKFLVIFALFIGLCASAGTYTLKTLPNVQVENRGRYLVNPDHIISPRIQAVIDTTLAGLRRATTCEMVVVVVDNIEPDDPETFATDLIREWGIGKKDKNNGVLMLVSVDGRSATIRTGYGTEGVLPDILCGRIVNDVMIPEFRDGNYDAGVLFGVQQVVRILENPEYRDELLSAEDDFFGDMTADEFFKLYLLLCVFITLGLVAWFVTTLIVTRKKTDFERYTALDKAKPVALALSFLGLGMPLLGAIPLVITMSHLRNHSRRCMRCGAKMHKVDEVHDNDHLTSGQDLEERLNSVDYDVWLCPECGETDIYPYVNAASSYRQCPNCHARTQRLVATRELVPATTTHPGKGVKVYECLHCGTRVEEPYDIPQKVDAAAAAVLGAAAASGRRGGGGSFGGGSFGGGFGGGLSGGGGATGRW